MRLVSALKGLSLAMAAALAFTAAPLDASAQGRSSRSGGAKPKPAAAAGPQLDRERGGREAPAAVTAARLNCAVTDAAFVGASNVTLNGATVTRNTYEVACREGLGYIVFVPQKPGPGVDAHDCIVVQASYRATQAEGGPAAAGALQCRLPANAQPALGLQAMVNQAAPNRCTVSDARYIGELTARQALRYEVSCSQGAGLVVDRPRAGGAVTLTNCLAYAGTPNACKLTTQAQLAASVQPLVTASQRPCTVNNVRIAGANPTTGAEVLEVGCAGQPGFFIETGANGQFVRSINCGRINNTPCQFTTAEAATEGQRAEVQRRLQTAGADCTVGEFRAIGQEKSTGREVYEVACTNRPQGAIVLLGSGTTARNEVRDCLFAPFYGTNCQLTEEKLVYPSVQRAMVLGGSRKPCTVNNAHWMGRTPQGENFFEVSCADGRAFVIDYRGNGQVTKTMTCRDAALIGSGCRAGDSASVPKN